MNVLALTHAHLSTDGLSPVSCERVDSLVNGWTDELGWKVDIVYTKNTNWRGIWPKGKGLNANIIECTAPMPLMTNTPELFSATARSFITKKQFLSLGKLVARRVAKRLRFRLSAEGICDPYELVIAKKWGNFLAEKEPIKSEKYDFIFACVGFGDEYLLQTALVLSQKLNVKMVVDFRDLWSDNHFTDRFTDKQRKLVRKYEIRLLRNTVLLSVPQKPMVAPLEKFLDIPIYVLTHSAHINEDWKDGHLVSDEFRMLYAGKLYAGNTGLEMILELLQKLSRKELSKKVKCHFFVDDVPTLNKLTAAAGVSANVVAHEWVSPATIWQEMRSAHLLLTFDVGIKGGMPILMTKSFQYALTGRPILALCKYGNSTYEDFFATYSAGIVCTTVDEQIDWVVNLINDPKQYEVMPALRKVPSRKEVAAKFGRHIAKLLAEA